MLGKLLKYELRATSKNLLAIYLALVVTAIVNRFFFSSRMDSGLPAELGMMVYSGLLIAAFVLTFVIMIQRFYNNLLGDEGYLMMTLPVTASTNILSKLIVSVLWLAASIAFALLSAAIIAWNPAYSFFGEILWAVNRLLQELELNGWQLIFETLLMSFLSTVRGVLMIYTAIAIGHLFPKHRFLWSVGAFFGLDIVRQSVISAAGTVYDMMGWRFMLNPHINMNLSSLSIALFGTACFFATRYVLKNRLNLE